MKNPRTKRDLVRIHRLSIAYGCRPSEILFPDRENANFKLVIDNLVYDAGQDAIIKDEIEQRTSEEELLIELTKYIIEAIYKSRG